MIRTTQRLREKEKTQTSDGPFSVYSVSESGERGLKREGLAHEEVLEILDKEYPIT